MTENEIIKLGDSFQAEVEEIVPHAKFAFGSYWSGSSEDSFGGYKQELVLKQDALNGTAYQIDGIREYIHYTTTNALFSILNEGEIRLSDLNHLNDPKEFDFLVNHCSIKMENEQIELFKRSLFVFSMCEYNDSEKDDFNMWRLYGNNGNGIGIVFELANESYDWYNYLVGKVNYNNPIAEQKLCKLLNIAKAYQEKGLNTRRFSALIGMLLLFHKNPIWEIEKEVRIATFCEYDPFTLESSGLDSSPHWGMEKLSFYLNSRSKESAYISHNLENKTLIQINNNQNLDAENKLKALRNSLRLRIKKVILGYNVPDQYCENLQMLMYKLARHGTPLIRVEHSKWRNVFDS